MVLACPRGMPKETHETSGVIGTEHCRGLLRPTEVSMRASDCSIESRLRIAMPCRRRSKPGLTICRRLPINTAMSRCVAGSREPVLQVEGDKSWLKRTVSVHSSHLEALAKRSNGAAGRTRATSTTTNPEDISVTVESQRVTIIHGEAGGG